MVSHAKHGPTLHAAKLSHKFWLPQLQAALGSTTVSFPYLMQMSAHQSRCHNCLQKTPCYFCSSSLQFCILSLHLMTVLPFSSGLDTFYCKGLKTPVEVNCVVLENRLKLSQKNTDSLSNLKDYQALYQ